MTPEELRQRTTAFAVAVVEFCKVLRRRPECRNIADQLSDSATAVNANYRSASRARSRKEFIAKLGIAVEEADESVGWLEVVVGTKLAETQTIEPLLIEAREILAILVASRSTAQRNDPERKR